MDQLVPLDEGDQKKRRQHAMHQAFRTRYKSYEDQAGTDDAFCRYYMMQSTRVAKNRVIDLWDRLGRDFGRVMEHVRMTDERIQEDSRGSKARYVQAEQLVAIYGKEKTDVYIANCKKLLPRFPELIAYDELFEAETYLLSERVVKTMNKERLTINFVTEPATGARGGCEQYQEPTFPVLGDQASTASSAASIMDTRDIEVGDPLAGTVDLAQGNMALGEGTGNVYTSDKVQQIAVANAEEAQVGEVVARVDGSREGRRRVCEGPRSKSTRFGRVGQCLVASGG